jgi:hypothetical protein
MFDEPRIHGAMHGNDGLIRPTADARVHNVPSSRRGCARARDDATIERHPKKPLPAWFLFRV